MRALLLGQQAKGSATALTVPVNSIASNVTAGHWAMGAAMSAAAPSDRHVDGEIQLVRELAAGLLRQHGYHVSAERLTKLAHSGKGPTCCRCGNDMLYEAGDLLAWVQRAHFIVTTRSRRRSDTSFGRRSAK